MGASTTHRKKRARTGPASTSTRANASPAKPAVTLDAAAVPDVDATPLTAHAPASATASLRLHDCLFVPWHVSGLTAVAASPCGTLIAAARTNGHVELRRRRLEWAVAAVQYGDGGAPELTVSAIAFSVCGKFLFVARLDGSLAVLRVSAEGLAEHVVLRPGGGAIWDVDVAAGGEGGTSRLALACDDGCVRFVEADGTFVSAEVVEGTSVAMMPADETHYLVRVSEGTKARMLSVAWAPVVEGREECVATGDAEGGIRWINPAGGVYGRGKIASLRMEHAKIWTVAFAAGGKELVCGDSRGMTTVWSCVTNTMKQELEIEGMKGALWSSVAVRDKKGGETVMFGCASGAIGGLQAVRQGDDDVTWVPLRGIHAHSHDVRGMASTLDGTLVSASMDARMCRFTVADFVDRRKFGWLLPYPGCVGQAPVQICSDNSVILSRRERGVDVWCMPDGGRSPLLKLRTNLKSIATDLIACAMSSDASLLAMSSYDSFRLYKVWDGVGKVAESAEFGKVQLSPISPKVETLLNGAIDITFRGHALLCVTRCKRKVAIYEDGHCRVFGMGEIGSDAAGLERIATGSAVVAVSDTKGRVFARSVAQAVWRDKEKDEEAWTLLFTPRGDDWHTITAMCFSIGGERLAVAAGRHVYARKVGKAREEDWAFVGKLSGIVTSMSFSKSGDSVLVSGEKFCAVAAMPKAPCKRNTDEAPRDGGRTLHYLPCGGHVLGSGILGSSSMVMVRKRWDQVQATLGDAVASKPFGT